MKFTKQNLIIIFTIGLFLNFFYFAFIGFVNALTNNYNKSENDSLSALEWNNLYKDYLATDGTNKMSGNFDMNSKRIVNLADPESETDAVNKITLENMLVSGFGSPVTDLGGAGLKIVCDMTTMGSTVWTVGAGGGIRTHVDTTNANFLDDKVVYFASLYANGMTGINKLIGTGSILNNLKSGFDIEISYINGTAPTVELAGQYLYISWCGIGKK